MERKELIESKEYHITKIQLDLYENIKNFMQENNINRTQLAKRMGVSKGYISQVLNGDFDHKLSKLVELSMECGLVPIVSFVPISEIK